MPVDLETQLGDYWTTVYAASPDLDAEEIRRQPLRPTAPDRRPLSRWRPVLVAGAAALVVLLLVGGAALLLRSAESEPADEFDYPMSEIPPFRAEVRYTLDPETYGEAAEAVTVAVAYGGDGLFRLELADGLPDHIDGDGHAVAAGSFTVLNGPERAEYVARENLFMWEDVVEGGVEDWLEPFSWEPWDVLCDFGVREILPSGRVAGHDTTNVRCSFGDDSYELSVHADTGLVVRASGGEVPGPELPGGCLCGVGFEVLSVEYEPDFADDHFNVEPPSGTSVEDLRGTAEGVGINGPEVGEPVPPLQGTTLAGENFDLADLLGSRVAVYFWASWCDPDLINPGLAELAAMAGTHPDLAIVTVAYRDPHESNTQRVLTEQGVELTTIQAPDHVEDDPFSDPWHIQGVPHLVLIDRDGTVVHSEPGYDSIGPLLYLGLLHDMGW